MSSTSMNTDQNTEQRNTPLGTTLPYLRAWRRHEFFTQRELTRQAHITMRTLYSLEHGGRARLSTIRKISNALDITPQQLVSANPDAAKAS